MQEYARIVRLSVFVFVRPRFRINQDRIAMEYYQRHKLSVVPPAATARISASVVIRYSNSNLTDLDFIGSKSTDSDVVSTLLIYRLFS